jgi:hypothetical protein
MGKVSLFPFLRSTHSIDLNMHRFSNTCVSFTPIKNSQTDAHLYTKRTPTLRREPNHAPYQRNTITLRSATVEYSQARHTQ